MVVGGAIDRGGLALPFAVGLGLFAIGLLSGGLAPSMLVLVVARFVQGLGAGHDPADRLRRHRADAARERCARGCSPRCPPPGSCPASSARRSPGSVGETFGWRFVFLGLLPLIALAGALTLGALRAVAPAPTSGPIRRRPPRHAAAACRWP